MRYTEVDGDVELEPGLRLIETSGHAIGHQSVYVETAAGPVLLAIDAINRAEHLDQREFPDWWSDHVAAKRSQLRLKALAAATGATMIFGHDAAQWATLPKSPAPFLRPQADRHGILDRDRCCWERGRRRRRPYRHDCPGDPFQNPKTTYSGSCLE